MTDHVLSPAPVSSPETFTQEELDWLAWLEPVPEDRLTDEQQRALIDPARAKSPYFRLLARDPAILEARTRTDKDIFHNPAGGLPRAERELAAVATSRLNGCIYCASVHARFASLYSKRKEDVQRLLDHGVETTIDERWDAIIAAATALSATPAAFGGRHIDRLRQVGLDDRAIADLIFSTAFFGWANRLMLSLGEPEVRRAK